MASAPAIGFEYRPSRLLPQACAVVAALAMLAIGLCGLTASLKIGLALAVFAIAARAAHGTARSAVTAVGWSEEAGWLARHADGNDATATLASSRVLGEYVLLRLAVAGAGCATLLLGPDNSDADIRRRLRMRLARARSVAVP